MKINKIMEKYLLIVILAIIAIGMGGVKFLFRNKDWGEEAKPLNKTTVVASPSPMATPTVEVRTLESLEFEKNYPLWEMLPYSGEGFVVEKYIEARTLSIRAKGLDKKIVIVEVEKWLESQGVASGSHELVIN